MKKILLLILTLSLTYSNFNTIFSMEKNPREEEQNSLFGNIPDDILSCIFEHIDKPNDIIKNKLVCRRWAKVYKHTLIIALDLHEKPFLLHPHKTINQIITIIKHHPNLKKLNLSGCLLLTGNDINTIIQNCPKLEALDLSYCLYLTDIDIEFLAIHLPNLTYIDFSECDNINYLKIIKLEKILPKCKIKEPNIINKTCPIM